MSDRGRSAGERIVHFCLGALVCAISLSLAIEVMQSVWPWLLLIGLIALSISFYVWRIRRW